MNATNNANGFAVEETKTNKPSTAAGVKSNINPESLAKQKTSKWAGGASSGAGKPPAKSTLGMAGSSIMRSSTESKGMGSSIIHNSSS